MSTSPEGSGGGRLRTLFEVANETVEKRFINTSSNGLNVIYIAITIQSQPLNIITHYPKLRGVNVDKPVDYATSP